jgi:hypothetical protein
MDWISWCIIHSKLLPLHSNLASAIQVVSQQKNWSCLPNLMHYEGIWLHVHKWNVKTYIASAHLWWTSGIQLFIHDFFMLCLSFWSSSQTLTVDCKFHCGSFGVTSSPFYLGVIILCFTSWCFSPWNYSVWIEGFCYQHIFLHLFLPDRCKKNMHMVATWLRYCATSQKVTGLIPSGVIGIFLRHIPSGHTMDLRRLSM